MHQAIIPRCSRCSGCDLVTRIGKWELHTSDKKIHKKQTCCKTKLHPNTSYILLMLHPTKHATNTNSNLVDAGICAFFLPFQVSLNKEPETCAATRATVACVAKRYRFDRFQSIQSIGHHSDQNCFPPTAQSYGVFSPLNVPERPMLLGTIPKRKCRSRRICVPRLN